MRADSPAPAGTAGSPLPGLVTSTRLAVDRLEDLAGEPRRRLEELTANVAEHLEAALEAMRLHEDSFNPRLLAAAPLYRPEGAASVGEALERSRHHLRNAGRATHALERHLVVIARGVQSGIRRLEAAEREQPAKGGCP